MLVVSISGMTAKAGANVQRGVGTERGAQPVLLELRISPELGGGDALAYSNESIGKVEQHRALCVPGRSGYSMRGLTSQSHQKQRLEAHSDPRRTQTLSFAAVDSLPSVTICMGMYGLARRRALQRGTGIESISTTASPALPAK